MNRPHLVTSRRTADALEVMVTYRGKDHILDVDLSRLLPLTSPSGDCREVLPLIRPDIDRLLDKIDQASHNVPDQAKPSWTCSSCSHCQTYVGATMLDCDRGYFGQDRINNTFGPGSLLKASTCPDFHHVGK